MTWERALEDICDVLISIYLFIYFYFFKFYFIFKLYIIVLGNINLNEHLRGASLGGLDGKECAFNAGDLGSIPVSGRSPGEGNGYPL